MSAPEGKGAGSTPPSSPAPPETVAATDRKAKEASALQAGTIVHWVSRGLPAVGNRNDDNISIAPSVRTSASAPAGVHRASERPVTSTAAAPGAGARDGSLERDGAQSVLSEPAVSRPRARRAASLDDGAAMAVDRDGAIPFIREDASHDVSQEEGEAQSEAIEDSAKASASDALDDSTKTMPGDDDALQGSASETRNEEEPRERGEAFLDAEVEATSRAPSQPPSLRSSRAAPPPGPSQATVCGIPVAQVVPVQGSDDEGGDDQQSQDEEAACDQVDDEDPELPAESQHTHHLRFLGRDVVVATMEDEGRAEGGVAARRRSSQGSLPSLPSLLSEGLSEGLSTEGRNKYAKYICGGAILAAIAVATAVGVAVAARNGNETGTESAPIPPLDPQVDENLFDVDPSPTQSPIQLHSEHKVAMQLLGPFLSQSKSTAHAQPGSPQYQAFEWIERTSLVPGGDFDLTQYVDFGQGTASPLPAGVEARLVQRYALSTLFHSLGGGNNASTHLPPHPSGHHECDWWPSRVVCDEDMRVVELDMVGQGLVGTLPNELRGLPHLRRIDMSSNPGLGGPLPDDIGTLSELRFLLLAHNSHTGTFPSSYGGLTNLEEIILRDNDLTGTIPPTVSAMASLSNIWLSGNRFVDGMDHFCVPQIAARLFYADCFCRNFPRLEPEVECSCCSMCCTEENGGETCNPNVSCQE